MSITQEQVTDTLIRDNTIKTNVQIVANTYLNISFDKLSKKLSLLNSLVNQKLFRYFRKYPDKRVAFFCNHERVENNTHSHKGHFFLDKESFFKSLMFKVKVLKRIQ